MLRSLVLCVLLACAAPAHAQLDAPDSTAALGDTLTLADTLATPAAVPGIAAPLTTTPAATAGNQDAPRTRHHLALIGDGRPNPLTAGARAAGNFVSDLVYFTTSPVRMDWTNVGWLGAIGAVGVGLYAADEEIRNGFVRSRENPLYEAVVVDFGGFIEPSGLVVRTNPILTGLAIAGWVLDSPILRTIPVEILESNSIVTPLRQPIERTINRARPTQGYGPRYFDGGSAFPSGHASVICETAAILSHHTPWLWGDVLIWGVTTVGLLQRVDEPRSNSHWPTDVWFGAALGTYAGHTFAMRNEERRRGVSQGRWWDITYHPKRNWSAMPVALPGGGGLAVRAKF